MKTILLARAIIFGLLLSMTSCTDFLSGDPPQENGPDAPQIIDPAQGPNFGIKP